MKRETEIVAEIVDWLIDEGQAIIADQIASKWGGGSRYGEPKSGRFANLISVGEESDL